MCFSISSSFSAAFLLSTIGIASLYKFNQKRTVLFAVIPLLFGMQQFFEGIVWVSLLNPIFYWMHWIGVYGFLFFAYIIWPIWVPLSLFMMEPYKKRKQILFFLMIIGALIALFLLYRLLKYGAWASLDEHILYHTHLGLDEYSYLYLIPTVISFFISSLGAMWLIAIIMLLSYALSHYIWKAYSISVWCYFAALLSGLVIIILQVLQDRYLNQHTTKRH